jgi:hypothetical protein
MPRIPLGDGRWLDSSCKRQRPDSNPTLARAVERIGTLHERVLSARRSPLGDGGLTPGFSREEYADAQWHEGVQALARMLEHGRAAKSEWAKLMACVESIAASADDETGARLREYELKQVRYLAGRILAAEAKHYGKRDMR